MLIKDQKTNDNCQIKKA